MWAGSIWESPGPGSAKTAFLEKAVRPRQASGGWNARDGFEHDRLAAILRQALARDDDPVFRGGGIDLCGHYRESQTIQVR